MTDRAGVLAAAGSRYTYSAKLNIYAHAAGFVLLVAVCFWWYYPLYVGNSIPYADWMRRMLLGNRWV